jgi:hypothetical protein
MTGRCGIGYPRYECERWGGRLAAPLAFRGTVIARDFESGRIGGRRVVASASFADDEAGRRALRDWAQRHRDGQVQICWLSGPRSPRRSVGLHEVLARNFIAEGLRAPR